WVHWDVSIGNIMFLKDPEVRNPVIEDETSENKCLGIILDADHVISLEQYKPAALSTHCMGTLPFMSYWIIDSWTNADKIKHTALNDFESFIWV
ncbi:hypothetical protein BS47DRAFT_1265412, partial [Hydnum rufescens UP504]